MSGGRIAQELRELRHRLDWTQKQMAQALGYKEATIASWENERSVPPRAVMHWCDVANYLLDLHQLAPKFVQAKNDLSRMILERGLVAAIAYLMNIVHLFSIKPPPFKTRTKPEDFS